MDFTQFRQSCKELGLNVSRADRTGEQFCVHLLDDAVLADTVAMAFRNPDGSASTTVKVQQDPVLETWSVAAELQEAWRVLEVLQRARHY